MARSVQMPPLGESVTEGTVSRWLKKVGDRIEVDEPLVEVTTDKVDTEIPSPFAGVLEKIVVGEDETAEVGAELAVIGDGAAAPEVVSTPQEPATSAEQPIAEEVTPAEMSPAAPSAPAEAPATAPAPPASTAPATPPPSTPPASTPPAGGATTDIFMPALGESVTEGTVTRWLVSVGDVVTVDQPLLEVSTDKVDTEVPSPVAGTVNEIVVAEDETVEVGAVLARIGDGSAPAAPPAAAPPAAEPAPAPEPVHAPEPAAAPEPAPAPEPPAAAPVQRIPAPASAPSVTAPDPVPPTTPSSPAAATADSRGGSAYVTPIVRKMAGDLGVDLATVTGTGVGGRVRRQDVTEAAAAQAAAAAASAASPSHGAAGDGSTAAGSTASVPTGTTRPTVAASPKRGTTEPMSRTRKVIASRMIESLQTSAQLTTVVEVDVTRVAKLRARAKAGFEAREGVKLSFMPFFALAAVEALKVHPVVNASTDGESITYHPSENLGIAVDTERGLMVPVIKDAGDLNLAGLARRISDLAEKTRARKVSPDDLSGSTFTLTNTGSRGALFDTPIINQPEVAILGTGAVVKRPVVVTDGDGNEGIAVRSMVYLALSYDHRIVDGADAARFLVTVKSRLEEGAFESDLGL